MNTPLYLPKGSVRAIIALSIVAVASYVFVSGSISPEEYLTLIAIVTGYYFSNRR